MVELPLPIAIVPDGFGKELFAVVCDDVKCENFKRAFHAARDIFDYSSNDINTVEGSLGKRRVQFHPQLTQAIEQLDYGKDHSTHLFDIVTVNNGTWAGLQAVAIGTNAEKRKKAAKIALAVAVVNDARCLTLQVPKRNVEVFQACTHVCNIDTELPSLCDGAASELLQIGDDADRELSQRCEGLAANASSSSMGAGGSARGSRDAEEHGQADAPREDHRQCQNLSRSKKNKIPRTQ